MKVIASVKKFREERGRPRIFRSWTVFLMTDAATEREEKYVISDRGRTQVSAAVEHLRSMTDVVPEVWLGAPYWMHDVTAKELVSQLGSQAVLRDRSATVREDFLYGDSARFGVPLTECPPERPIVLVALYAHCQRLLEAAGVSVRTTGRAVRSSRVYPVKIDHRGNVRLAPLLDYVTDARELTLPIGGPDSDTRD